MSNREKWFLLIICLLLLVIMFSGESFRKKNKLIKENKTLISDYKHRINSNKLMIDSLNFELKSAKKTDTVIKIRYKQKIDSVYVYNYYDYVVFYDTLLNTNIAAADTFLCFDSITIQKLSIKLLECGKDSELLANCYLQNNIYSNIIAVQDSVIILKDSVINSNDKIYSSKIKKVKKQRNTAIVVAFTELLLIIGILAK